MRKIILPLIALFLIGIVYAVPANPSPVTLEQPDGHKFTARAFGDEKLNWIETENGYTIEPVMFMLP